MPIANLYAHRIARHVAHGAFANADSCLATILPGHRVARDYGGRQHNAARFAVIDPAGARARIEVGLFGFEGGGAWVTRDGDAHGVRMSETDPLAPLLRDLPA